MRLSRMDGAWCYSRDKVARTFIPFLWRGFQKHSCCQGNPSWKSSLTAVTAGGSFSPEPPLLFPDTLSDQWGLGAALKKGLHCGYSQQQSLFLKRMLVIRKNLPFLSCLDKYIHLVKTSALGGWCLCVLSLTIKTFFKLATFLDN